LPDLIIVHSENIGKLADKGIIVPIDEWINQCIDITDFYIALFESVKYKDKIWSLPLLEANPYALFLNLNLFEKFKKIPFPTNWDELKNVASKLTLDTDKDGLIDSWGYSADLMQFLLFLWQNEGELFNHNFTEVLFHKKEGVQALQFLIHLNTNFSPPHKNFERGDIGMQIGKIEDISRYKNLRLSILPLPKGKIKANSFGGLKGSLGFSIINKDKKRQDVAFDVIKLLEKIENYILWCKLTNFIPLKKSVLKNEDYNNYLNVNPYLRVFIDELNYAKSIPCISTFPEIRNILNTTLETLNLKEELNYEEIKKYLYECAKETQKLLR
jgi:multiple sugar transport system substrate-binding protein